MKKFITWMLLAAMTASLAACGGETPSADTTEAATTTAEPEVIYDMEGFTLNILKMPQKEIQWVLLSLGTNEETGEILNDTIVTRNRTLTEKHNFKIVETELSNPAGVIRKMVSAGDDEYQVLFSSIDASLLTGDQLIDATGVDTLKLDADCWDQNLLESLSIGDKTYLLGGDISVADEDCLEVLVYNTSFAKSLQLENLYEAVDAGTWTIDKMLSCMKLAASDLNSDTKMDLEDSYGLISNNDGVSAMLVSCGAAVIAKNEEDVPTLMADSEHYAAAFAKLASVFDKSVWHSYDGVTPEMHVSCLENNRVLFINAVTSFARRFLRDVKTDFGFLPTPKLDEAQERYYSASVPSTCTLGIPASCGDVENTGLALQLLAEGSGDLSHAYYEICLQSKYTRDEESYDMLRLSTENIYYDFGYFYTSQLGGLHNKLVTDLLKGGEGLSSIVAASKEMTEQKIKEFYGLG
ncbi:MAG: hypothetical protein E7632_09040 [Ruminococcaceae bacterium]|nr:hypothetical protein [Oscillospiraceae bacterium]